MNNEYKQPGWVRFYRALAWIVFVVGVVIFGLTLWRAVNGQLVERYFPEAAPSFALTIAAFALRLPIPLHIMAIGLIVQKPYLSRPLAKFSWFFIVTSGCWLGLSLAIRHFVL